MSGVSSGIPILIKALSRAQERSGEQLTITIATYVVETCYGVDFGPGTTGKQVIRILEACGHVKVEYSKLVLVEEKPKRRSGVSRDTKQVRA